MSRYYAIGPWVWEKPLDAEPYWRPPDGCIGAIDLRSVLPLAQTNGFFAFDAPLKDSAYMEIGDGTRLDSYQMTAADRAAWDAAFHVRLPTVTTLLDAMWGLLTVQSDPTGQERAKPLLPTMAGNLELHLGGHSCIRRIPFKLGADATSARILDVLKSDLSRIREASLRGEMGTAAGVDTDFHRRVRDAYCRKYHVADSVLRPADWPADETPLKHQTTLSESFDKANSSTLGPVYSWSEYVSGTIDWTVYGNALRCVTTVAGSTYSGARADSDLSSDDHEATLVDLTELVVINWTTSFAGAVTRFDAAAHNGYAGMIGSEGNPAAKKYRFGKVVAGTFTSLAAAAHEWTLTTDVKLRSDGSTHTLWDDSGQLYQGTDSTHTGYVRCGVGAQVGANDRYWLNALAWSAADLSAPPAGNRRRRLLIGV